MLDCCWLFASLFTCGDLQDEQTLDKLPLNLSFLSMTAMPIKKSADRLRYRISIPPDSPLYERLSSMSEKDAKDWLLTAANLLHHLSASGPNGQVAKLLHLPAPDLQPSKRMDEKAPPHEHRGKPQVAVSSDAAIAAETDTRPTGSIAKNPSLNGLLARTRKALQESP